MATKLEASQPGFITLVTKLEVSNKSKGRKICAQEHEEGRSANLFFLGGGGGGVLPPGAVPPELTWHKYLSYRGLVAVPHWAPAPDVGGTILFLVGSCFRSFGFGFSPAACEFCQPCWLNWSWREIPSLQLRSPERRFPQEPGTHFCEPLALTP